MTEKPMRKNVQPKSIEDVGLAEWINIKTKPGTGYNEFERRYYDYMHSYVSLNKFALILGVHPHTLYKWIEMYRKQDKQ